MKFLITSLLLISLYISHVQSADPPTKCKTECTPFIADIDKCKVAQRPQDSDTQGWGNMATKAAQCVCPYMKGSTADTCNICVSSNFITAASTKLMNGIKSDCDGGHFDQVGTKLIGIWGGPKLNLVASTTDANNTTDSGAHGKSAAKKSLATAYSSFVSAIVIGGILLL